MIPRVLTIAGSDSCGGAGLQADLKTFAALGVYGSSVVTAITAQNSLGVQGSYVVPAQVVGQQIDSVLSDLGCDAAKTGMLATEETVKMVADKVKEYGVPNLVIDPVFSAKDGHQLLSSDAVGTFQQELVPLAKLITPNLPEAEKLLGRKIEGLSQAREAVRALAELGCEAVLLKGGHLPGAPVDLLFAGGELHQFRGRRMTGDQVHGTGCILSAAIAAYLARGESLLEAVGQGRRFLQKLIRSAAKMGSGFKLIPFARKVGE